MGGMFSMLKVRKNQKPGDYRDPGWYKHPAGTVAYEWTGALPDPARPRVGSKAMPAAAPGPVTQVQIRKPSGHAGH